MREKFCIRFYNSDLTHIKLEKKSKMDRLSNKQEVVISKEEAKATLSEQNGLSAVKMILRGKEKLSK